MKELDKITNLDSIYYVDSYHKVFKSTEEFKEQYNTKDYGSTLEQELKWLREFTGREIVQNIINTLKEENDYLFHKAYDLEY